MGELRIGSRERIEVLELDDDAALLRHSDLAKAIDPRRKIGGIVLGKSEDTLRLGVKIGGALPEGGIERVNTIPELLKTRNVLGQQRVLVIQRYGTALKQLNVEPLERGAFGARRRSPLLFEQSHWLGFSDPWRLSFARPKHRRVTRKYRLGLLVRERPYP